MSLLPHLHELHLRYLLAGDRSTGRRSLVFQALHGCFTASTVDLDEKRSHSEDWGTKLVSDGKRINLRLRIPDELRFTRTICQTSWREIGGVLVVFDLASRTSFDSARDSWFKEACRRTDDVPIVLVGNKSDLTAQRVVSREEAEELCKVMSSSSMNSSGNIPYFETTATDHESAWAPFQYLIQLTMKAWHGDTPLHQAAFDGNDEQIRTLAPSSDIDKVNALGQSPLHRAAERGHASAIETLVRLGSKAIDTPERMDKHTPLHVAAMNGHTRAIEMLVRLGSKAIDTTAEVYTPMHLAASNGHVSAIEALVRLGSRAIDTPDISDGWSPIRAAAENRHISVIETLVRLGSKAIDTLDKSNGWSPIRAAAEKSHVLAIETLVRLGSKAVDTPDIYGITPFHAAASNGHVSVIETLVRLGSKAIDTPDHRGRTPMHAAASSGHVSVIETLVGLGSEAIDAPDKEGRTPLHAAAFRQRAGSLAVLFRLGSTALDTLDKSGHSAMFYASGRGRPFCWSEREGLACVRLLLAMGHNLTAQIGHRTERVELTLTEDEVMEQRHRVYFSQSLVQQLLSFIIREEPAPSSAEEDVQGLECPGKHQKCLVA